MPQVILIPFAASWKLDAIQTNMLGDTCTCTYVYGATYACMGMPLLVLSKLNSHLARHLSRPTRIFRAGRLFDWEHSALKPARPLPGLCPACGHWGTRSDCWMSQNDSWSTGIVSWLWMEYPKTIPELPKTIPELSKTIPEIMENDS